MARQIKSKIKALQLNLASSETIRGWSYGEVKKAETINYKTGKPEREGLFDEVIFGPVKDYTCTCGRYKSIKFRGRKCEKCGVEITESSVRRERMGHIELYVPIAHPWFIRELPNPSKISLVLGVDRKIEEVIYFIHYIVLNNNGHNKYFENKYIIDFTNKKENRTNRIKIRKILDELVKPKLTKNSEHYARCQEYYDRLQEQDLPFSIDEVFNFISKYTGIRFGIGSAAVQELLKQVDLKEEIESIKKQIKPGIPDFNRLMSRLQVLNWFKESSNKPEDMILSVIPVTPPETRPLIQLEGGNYTTSDINELYRRVIIRNERLKRLVETRSPTIIINNEKRMLQEAVDSLFDNSSRAKPRLSKDKQPLKSLSDNLKGKTGLFRQNLLGKRVDYSARSTIVGGPELKLYEAGIPTEIILKIFKPFIISELIRRFDDFGNETGSIVTNIRDAEKLITQQDDIIWPIVHKVIKERPVLLNRAPTLHRLGIQAFEIKMVEGKAIRLHPLVTSGFNADFDGDTMAVHLPLCEEAVNEARHLLLASKQIIAPKDGRPVITPTIDMLVGVYYVTTEKRNQLGEGTIFGSVDEVKRAYAQKLVDLHALVGIGTNCYSEKGLGANNVLITTVGKILFNEILPADMKYVNSEDVAKISNEDILKGNIVDAINERKLAKPVAKANLSKIITMLYENYDINTVARTADAIKDIGFEYATKSGTTFSIFDFPKYSAKEEYIRDARERVAVLKKQHNKGLLTEDERYLRVIEEWTAVKNKVIADMKEILVDPANQYQSVIIMSNSGARGNISQFTQMVGMRGLMTKSYNYDQRSKDSNIVKDTIEVPVIDSFYEGLSVNEYFNASYSARKAMADTALKTSKSGYMTRKLVDSAQEVIVSEEDCGTTVGLKVEAIRNDQGQVIETLAERIQNRYSMEDVTFDGTTFVKAGEFISPEIAAQINAAGIETVEIRSVLHCNCKFGVCQKCYGTDLSTSKPIEIGSAVGVVAAQSIGEPVTQINMNTKHTGGVAGGTQIAQGYERIKQLFDVVPPKEFGTAIISPINGRVKSINDVIDDNEIKAKAVEITNEIDKIVLNINPNAQLLVKLGDEVTLGQKINQGSINLRNLLEVKDIETTRKYIIAEVQRVYRSQGIEINDKYIEVIVKQMTSKLRILNSGDSSLFIGQTIDINTLTRLNTELLSEGKQPITARPEILGLDEIPARAESFLAAASFQYTKRILINAAIRGQVDNLLTLKENIMLGSLIPAGTGLKDPTEMIEQGEKTFREEY